MDARRVGAGVGVVGVAALVVTILGLTIRQDAYLDAVGWSPVHRTPTGWPSILAVGPSGWLMSLGFAVAAAALLVLTVVIASTGRSRTRAAVAGGLALVVIGLVGVAFPADSPTSTSESWHATVHNTLYPLVPLGTIVVAAALSWPWSADAAPLVPTRRARLLLVVLVVSFGLTNLDRIAQLARYVAFGAALVLVLMLSAGLWNESRLDPRRVTGPPAR